MTGVLYRSCASCGARILWCVTPAGRRIPVDADPVPGGNLRLAGQPGGTTQATVAGAAVDLFDGDDGSRYVSHFATCPHASEHRRPRR